jgi:hypothetical protein
MKPDDSKKPEASAPVRLTPAPALPVPGETRCSGCGVLMNPGEDAAVHAASHPEPKKAG